MRTTFMRLLTVTLMASLIVFAQGPIKPRKSSFSATTPRTILPKGESSSLAGGSLRAQGLAASLPHVTGTRKMVLEVIESILSKRGDGVKLLGQGSWLRVPEPDPNKVKKASYVDPLLGGSSDHDVRVILEGKAGTAAEQEAMRQSWMDVRKKFIEGLEEKIMANASNLEAFLTSYGIPADKAKELAKQPVGDLITIVKKSVNLYPPDQIVKGIIDDATAVVRFKTLGAVPNLANLAPEGVWGPGKQVTVQQLENFSRARLFFRDGNVVRAGFADLVHMAESYGCYTRAGAANMAYQWIGKALEAIDHGDVRLLAKYLERVRDELKIVKARGGLPQGFSLNTFSELETYYSRALSGQSAVAGDPQLKALLKELQLQTGILYKLEHTGGESERAVLTALLTRKPGAWSGLSKKLREVAPSLSEWATMESFLDGTMLLVSAYLVPRTAASESVEAAYRQAGVDLSFMAGLGPGFAGLLTNIILDDAKAFGYGLAVQPQEWDNFINGISQVKGFQGVMDGKGVERSIDGLAQQMTSKEQVASFVKLQARNIATLNPEADVKKREEIEQRLVEIFTPVVIGRWQKQRAQMIADALEVLPEVEEKARELSVRVDIEPETVTLTGSSASVPATPVVSRQAASQLEAAIAKYREVTMRLGGAKKDLVFLHDTYRARWSRDGAVVSDKSYIRLVDALQAASPSVNDAGVHQIGYTLDVDLSVDVVGLDPEDVVKTGPLFKRHITQTVNAEFMAVTKKSEPPQPLISGATSISIGIGGWMKVNFRKPPVDFPTSTVMQFPFLESGDFGDLTWSGNSFSLKGAKKESLAAYTFDVTGTIDQTARTLKNATATWTQTLLEEDPWRPGTPGLTKRVSLTLADVPIINHYEDNFQKAEVWAFAFPKTAGHIANVVVAKHDAWHADEAYDFAGWAEGMADNGVSVYLFRRF